MHDNLRKALFEISNDLISIDHVDKEYKDEYKDVVKERGLVKYIEMKLDRYHWVEARAAFGILVLIEKGNKQLDKVSWIHLARARAILGRDHVRGVLVRNKIDPDKLERQ